MSDWETISKALNRPVNRDDVKPCPFCGAFQTARFQAIDNGVKWVAVACGECGAVGPDVRTGYAATGWEDGAVREWNTRSTNLGPLDAG